MIIKTITLQGFKSFGRKTTFQFDGGVTAVVGPNGSGKSNLADGLRWVLGEQSPRTLRVKKTDDLIFAGTGEKARGSVAEVSVLFDNSQDLASLGYSEVEISRKLYGSGESDYRLNGRKVRLQEIQHVLAQARIGAASYAIIGQGVIDSFILATPAERKTLFEEASGIRAFELQRTQALKRLRSTEENMQRARDVLAELEPRLTILERTLASVRQRDELREELEILRHDLAVTERQETESALKATELRIGELDLQLAAEAERIAELEKQQAAVQTEEHLSQQHQKTVSKRLRELEAAREQLLNDSSVQQAELQHLRERLEELGDLRGRLADAEATVKAAARTKTELARSLKDAESAQAACVAEREALTATVRRVQQRLVRQRQLLQDVSHHEYVTHAQTIVTDLQRSLQDEAVDREQLQNMAIRVRRLLKLATDNQQGEVVEQLRQLQAELGEAIRGREAIDERYTQTTLELRRLELELESAEREGEAARARLAKLKSQLAQTREVQANITRRERKLDSLQTEVAGNQRDITDLREQLARSVQPSINQAVATATELEQLRQAQGGAKGELAELKAEQATLARRLKTLPKATQFKGLARASAEELEQRILQGESRLVALEELGGGVDSEHAEVKQRHQSLSTQLADLDAAKVNLETVINQLDDAIKGQFETGFYAISERFQHEFQRLFDGGVAKLTLQTAEDGELGIEIEVTPPGKRVRHLTALSGGERSLAGIALIAAILHTHPSPFVMLDEVDAALDESNAGRFQQLLTELAENSQIIVITHNRQTMLAAGSLFGVTMDHEHVSQVVSVRLAEAEALSQA